MHPLDITSGERLVRVWTLDTVLSVCAIPAPGVCFNGLRDTRVRMWCLGTSLVRVPIFHTQ